MQSTASILAAFFAASFVWTVYTIVYRFFLHPLAAFPGPKLAIATYLYEYYFDIVQSGQYTFQLGKLHNKYGPVIRINPDELHINDPDYYDEVFNSTNGNTLKPYKVANAFGPYPAAIGTVDHDLHRIRRGALNPFFSKRSVDELIPYIQNIIDDLCERFRVASKTREPINLRYCFAALTQDIMNEFCFSRNPHTILKPDFGRKSFDDIDGFLEMSLINVHLTWVMKVIYSLPDWFTRLASPVMADVLDFREALAKQVEDIRLNDNESYESVGHYTIFHSLLKSNLPGREKTRGRLRDEAFSLITAGSGTSAYVLKVASYHIAANPNVRLKLLRELRTVMLGRNDPPKLQDLERLPYITTVIQESLRMSHPVTHRLSRIFKDKTLIYKGLAIPPGTIVNMTALLIHENEDVFPELKVFRPERWLAAPQQLQRSLSGIKVVRWVNLAWAEMYLIRASVFRQFDFDLTEVSRERDIDVARDVIMGVPSSESRGVIVQVLEIDP